MDHTQALGTCASCHNGTKATGKPPTHITTSADCGDCHKTVAWLPATFDHANVTGNCGTCHNGTKATGKPGNHFVTTVECVECHRTAAWLPVLKYQHTGGGYPGQHAQQLDCLDCHKSNSQTVPYQNPGYAPNCAACHTNDYDAGEHKKFGNTNYTVSELRDCTGACHEYTDASMVTIKKRRTGEHRVSSPEF
ncbi:MAG: cytochrome c3 family protein [Sphingorhabdus sp.]